MSGSNQQESRIDQLRQLRKLQQFRKVQDGDQTSAHDSDNQEEAEPGSEPMGPNTKEKKGSVQESWHPLFKQASPKVTLLSSDNVRLQIGRQLLSDHSSVFKDMFSLPTNTLSDNQMEPISVDATADAIALMLIDLEQHESEVKREKLPGDLDVLHAAADLQAKFEMSSSSISMARFNAELERDPFAGFAFASRRKDLVLGRRMIRNMSFKPDSAGQVDFWKKISNAKPTWQLALARLMMPTTGRTTFSESAGMFVFAFDAKASTNMAHVAAHFIPRDK